jgi:hypothetical protein
MSSVLRCCLVLVLLSVHGLAQADPVQIRAWITQLESADFAQREAATKALRQAGAAAESALREARQRASPEACLRIDALLLDTGARTESAHFEFAGTRVTFPPEPRPFAELVQMLANWGGTTIRCQGAEQELESDTKDSAPREDAWLRALTTPPAGELSWLQALEFLATTGGVWWRREPTGGLTLAPGRVPSGHVLHDGALRCSLNSLTITRSLSPGQPPYSAMHLQFQLDLEPGPLPLFLLMPVTGCEAKDDQGRSIAAQHNGGLKQHATALGLMRQTWFNASFETPARDAERLAELKVALAFAVPEEVMSYELQPVRTESSTRPAGAQATLGPHQRLSLTWPAGGAAPLAGVSGFGAQDQVSLLNERGEVLSLPMTSNEERDGMVTRLYEGARDVSAVRIMVVKKWRTEQRTLSWRDLALP